MLPSRRLFATRTPCLLAAVAATCLGAATRAHAQEIDVTRYHRAERLLAWNVNPLLSGDAVAPQWMAGGNRFWYRNQTNDGTEFVLADPARGSRTLLFDHDRLASAMSVAADTAFEGRKLPFRTFEFGQGDGSARDEQTIRFNANKRGFTCDIGAYTCEVGDTLVNRTPFVRNCSVKPW